MINDCLPFLCYIVSNIRHEKKIVDTALVRKLIFDDSDFLSGKENSRSIKEKIEGMF